MTSAGAVRLVDTAPLQDREPARRPSAWTLTPETDFINSLCSVDTADFPIITGTTEQDRDILHKACRRGFYAVVNRHDDERIQGYFGKPNAAELRTLWVIGRKTLRFNKLFEKIPRRFFREGQESEDGEWIIPKTGMDDRMFSKGRNGLMDKGLITCIESAPHPQFGPSSVYCIGNASDVIVRTLFGAAVSYISSHHPSHQRAVYLQNALGAAIVDECEALWNSEAAALESRNGTQ